MASKSATVKVRLVVEVTTANAWGDECGSQPPQRVGNERVNGTEVSEEDAPAFVAACVAIGDALVGTGGKWGCA
jgi:hypothetical protein